MKLSCLTHHGGHRNVTGSFHPLHLDAFFSLPVDCGLEQGSEASSYAASAPIGFAIDGIQALMSTGIVKSGSE